MSGHDVVAANARLEAAIQALTDVALDNRQPPPQFGERYGHVYNAIADLIEATRTYVERRDARRFRWLITVGVTFIHVCNLLLWGGICVQMWRELSGIQLLAILLPAAVFVGNAALAVEEEMRQWRAC